MSDSVSSASQTVNTTLSSTSSVFGKSNFWQDGITIFLWLCIFILLFSLLSSSLNALYVMDAGIVCECSACGGGNCASRNCDCVVCKCSRNDCDCDEPRMIEHFSDDAVFSYNAAESANYQAVPLTAQDTSDHTPANLVFGEAKKWYINKDGNVQLTIQITANLYILDGNVFKQNSDGTVQKYIAYLSDKSGKRMELGDLKRDGDGIYKLKFSSQDPLLQFKNIHIAYKRNDSEEIVIEGNFK